MLSGLYACANQGFPPGGPEDRTPPEIISTEPDMISLNVPTDQNVEILFSEKINAGTVAKAVFISPTPGENTEIKVNGKRLLIRFSEPLIKNMTYTITLGTGIKDLHGNGLLHSFTLAFSTGAQLDHNEISGKVFAEKPEEVTVWAYFLETGSVVNPSLQRPRYITQCSSDGSFEFTNLAPRKYRLFAVDDRIKNQTYQIGRETIGVTSSDIVFPEDTTFIGNKFFRLTKRDTSRLRIVQADQADRRHFRIRFSKPVFPTDSTLRKCRLSDGENHTVQILDLFFDEEQPEIWSFTTVARDSGRRHLFIYSFPDQFRNFLPDSIRFDFSGIVSADTSRPALAEMVPEDSSQIVEQNSPLKFVFSESIDTVNIGDFFSLFRDSVAIDNYTCRWKNLTTFSIIPDSLWRGLTWYRGRLDTEEIKDFAGNLLRLKKNEFSWRIIDPDTLTSISGRILDEDSAATGPVCLQLQQAGRKEKVKQICLPDTGMYRFDKIFPGKYFILGFRDVDKNGIYSYGSVVPFYPAERFFVATDTILVRSRWPNEGNNYILRK